MVMSHRVLSGPGDLRSAEHATNTEQAAAAPILASNVGCISIPPIGFKYSATATMAVQYR